MKPLINNPCKTQVIWILLLTISLVTSGCSQPEPPATSTPAHATENVSTATPTQSQPATDTPSPSPTPQPKVVFACPETALAILPAGMADAVQSLAAESGLIFEPYSGLQNIPDLSGVQIVVTCSQDPELAAFAVEHPQVNLLVLATTEIAAGGNTSVLNLQGGGADQQGFLAGYLSSLITQDWRVGVLSQADSLAGRAARLGFVNGVVFYCGLCRPLYPPFYQYPVFSEVPPGASLDAQKAAADILINNAVQTVYVFPELAAEPLLDYLAQAGIKLISGSTPSPAIREQWVATIQLDWRETLAGTWNRLLSGESGFKADILLSIVDANPNLLSAGRMRLVEQLSNDLQLGFIDSGVDPQTGELK